MRAFSLSDIGSTRQENQDKVFTVTFDDDSAFAVVCDGMGGENAGSLASDTAIDVISERVKRCYRENSDENSVRRLLVNAVRTANEVVFEIGGMKESTWGMGTTCVAVLRRGNRVFCVNAGDSRAYAVTGGDISQITKDHTVVRELFEQGEITEEEMKTHPQRNLITRAIGVNENLSPDYFETIVSDDTVILLCSDGLYGCCDDSDIAETMSDIQAEDIPAALVELAIDSGSTDNITAAIVLP